MSALITECTVTLEDGVKYKRRTTSWQTAAGTVASHNDHFAGEVYLNPRIWSDVVEKIDRALDQEEQVERTHRATATN